MNHSKTQQSEKCDSLWFVQKGQLKLGDATESTHARGSIRQLIRTGASSLIIVALHGLLPLPARRH